MQRLVAQRLVAQRLVAQRLSRWVTKISTTSFGTTVCWRLRWGATTGENRVRERDRGHPLARTLNRFELGGRGEVDRYKKAETKKMDDLQVALFLKAPPKEIFPDIDATDAPVARQPGGPFLPWVPRLLPLYVVCGDHALCSQLRPSNVDGAGGFGGGTGANWRAS